MVWFIMAAIMYAESGMVDFKISQYSQFNTQSECIEYINTYDEYIKAGLRRTFPGSKVLDIRCVDSHTINSMQKHMKKGEEVSNG